MTPGPVLAAGGGVGVPAIGGLIILGLIVVVVLLLLSMNRHIKKVPRDFPADGTDESTTYPERDESDPADASGGERD